MRIVLRGVVLALAVGALVLSVMPWLGPFSNTLDALASFVPVAVLLAVLALVVGFGRSGVLAPVLATVALLLSLGRMAPEWLRPSEPPAQAGARQLTIVTHNLSKANVDPQGTIRALEASGADVLLLQEAKGAIEPVLYDLARTYPYHSDCKIGCDPAIFSKLPLDRVRWKFRDANDKEFGPPMFWTRLYLPDGSTPIIVSWHAPWPFPSNEQARERQQMIGAIMRVDSSNLILAGDFNLTPWGHGMRTLESGLFPLRRITHGRFSFPARVAGVAWPLPFLPIDQMFVGPAWDVVSIERLPRTGSDHYPLRIRLAQRRPGT